jgi:hypothetical protein
MQDDLTPEMIARSRAYTKAERLDRLEGMRRDVLGQREAGGMKDDTAAELLAEIDRAVDTIKGEQETGGAAIGRTTSA